MNALSSIALSGMAAAQGALGAHAHNVANLGTADFRRSTTVQATLAGGGVSSRPVRVPAPGHALETDLVGQLQAKNAFLANLAVFRTGDAMTGALLDAVG